MTDSQLQRQSAHEGYASQGIVSHFHVLCGMIYFITRLVLMGCFSESGTNVLCFRLNWMKVKYIRGVIGSIGFIRGSVIWVISAMH